MMHRHSTIAFFILTLVLAAPAHAEPFEKQAKQLVATALNTASGLGVGTPEDRAKSAARLREFVERRIATKSLARFVLGHYWRRADKAEFAKFQSLFGMYLTRKFGLQAARLSKQPVEIDDIVSTTGTNDVLVFSRLGRRGPQALLIDWRLRRSKDGPKIIDIIVQGSSLAVAQREQFLSILSRNGGSIAALNQKLTTRYKIATRTAPGLAGMLADAK